MSNDGRIRANDIVRHTQSGEKWIVCGVNYNSINCDCGELIACGYPFPSFAKISDCELVEARNLPQLEEYKTALRRAGFSSFIEDEEVKPRMGMTNFDRITKSPEALAKALTRRAPSVEGAYYYTNCDEHEYYHESEAIKVIMEWLNQPAESEE